MSVKIWLSKSEMARINFAITITLVAKTVMGWQNILHTLKGPLLESESEWEKERGGGVWVVVMMVGRGKLLTCWNPPSLWECEDSSGRWLDIGANFYWLHDRWKNLKLVLVLFVSRLFFSSTFGNYLEKWRTVVVSEADFSLWDGEKGKEKENIT